MTTTIEKNEFGEDVVVTILSNGAVLRELLRPLPPATRSDDILTRLSEIDRLSDSPRARREAMLGDTVWLKSLNDEAALLRAELATL